jgi:hypothetical protein
MKPRDGMPPPEPKGELWMEALARQLANMVALNLPNGFPHEETTQRFLGVIRKFAPSPSVAEPGEADGCETGTTSLCRSHASKLIACWTSLDRAYQRGLEAGEAAAIKLVEASADDLLDKQVLLGLLRAVPTVEEAPTPEQLCGLNAVHPHAVPPPEAPAPEKECDCSLRTGHEWDCSARGPAPLQAPEPLPHGEEWAVWNAELQGLRDAREQTDREKAAMLDDLGSLLEALGRPNVARPDTPQAVMRECIEAVRILRSALARIGSGMDEGGWCAKCGNSFTQLIDGACPRCYANAKLEEAK